MTPGLFVFLVLVCLSNTVVLVQLYEATRRIRRLLNSKPPHLGQGGPYREAAALDGDDDGLGARLPMPSLRPEIEHLKEALLQVEQEHKALVAGMKNSRFSAYEHRQLSERIEHKRKAILEEFAKVRST